ncbi:MAG: hypothetical protein H7Y31_01035, partial [Chitinophagaceae bacterium]|nr:hypothetical protein [Chitinophagaceae bacterium]
MKKLYMLLALLASLLVVLPEHASAQTYPEIEPNNSFSTATLLKRYPDTLVATVSSIGGIDYYKFDLSYYINTLQAKAGTLSAYFVVTNNGATGDVLKVELFNGLQGGGLVTTENFNNIAAGQTGQVQLQACGNAIDDYYLAVSTAGNFSYRMIWYFSDANPNSEPNNTRATATTIPYSPLPDYREAIQYRYRGNPDTDTVDYFKTVLPAGNYQGVSLNIKAKNNSCLNGQWIQYAAYKNSEITPFQTGYVGNSPTIPMFTEASTSVSLADFNEGDEVFVKVWSVVAFGYELSFSEEEIVFEEEYNDIDYEGYSSMILDENVVVVAQVGYHVRENGEELYDEEGDPVIDNYDTYDINMSADGELVLYVSGLNNDCGNGLYYDILDEWGSSISNQDYKELLSWNGECFETKSAVIRIAAVMAGTYKIRIHNGNWGYNDRMSYSFKYQVVPYNSGGQTDLEPNNTQGLAKPIVVSQVNKGYVRFISENTDEIDMYRTTMAAEAKVTVYMKATYRGESAPATIYNSLTFFTNTSSFTRRIPLNRPVASMVKGTVYLDTFSIAAVPQGQALFYLYSDEPYEYEFRYEIEEVIIGPNDTEPNNTIVQAQPILITDTTYGRIGYVVNGLGDQNDYFRSVIPADGTVKIFIKATNRGDAAQIGFDWLDFTVFDGRGSGGTIFNKHLNNNNNIPLGATVYDTITVCGLAADTIYFRVNSYQKFTYDFRFQSIQNTVNNSTEPDNNFAQALKLKANRTYSGTVGYWKRNVADGLDYYKASFGSKDTLRLAVKATNYGCAPAGLRIILFNKQQSQLFSRFLNNNAAVAIGAEVTENISIPIVAPDSIYVRFESSTAFQYEFTTGPLVPSSFYTLSGDTTVCFGTQTYRAHNITDSGFVYNWSLPQGGGTLTFTDSVATVTWSQAGNRIVQLVLSNSAGNSEARQLRVIVNNDVPTQIPVAYNFSRMLSTNSLPPGATVQWFRNNIAIAGATDTSYYAADGGAFSVKFINDCGTGPVSNAITFANPASPQTITIPSRTPITMTPNLALSLNATASSGMRIFYQKISGPATLTNDTIQVTGVGTIVIKAYQPGDDVFSPAANKFDTIIIVKGPQAITFDSIENKIFTDPPFVLGASSSSELTVAYTSPTNNATYHNGKLTLTGAGVVTIRASQDGNGNYFAATPVNRSF